MSTKIDQPAEKFLREGAREEPMEQESGGSQSSDDSSDGSVDSQAKSATLYEDQDTQPPPFILQGLSGTHNHSTPTLPSGLHFQSNRAAEGNIGNNNESPNLGIGLSTYWTPRMQSNPPDLATPLGSRDLQYRTLNQTMGPSNNSYPTAGGVSQYSQYQNMLFMPQGMEDFNMGGYYYPNYNYLEGFPVQPTKLVDWVSQAPGPEPQNNLAAHPPNNYPNRSISRGSNSLYDPIYEAMGLPVDPHLRMFLARRNKE